MNDEPTQQADPEERAIARLLAAVGPRAAPPQAVADEVRRAVEAEWRATVAARRPQRRPLAWAMAAGLAVAAIGAWLAQPLLAPAPTAAVAGVLRATGAVEYRRDAGSGWSHLVAGQAVAAGGELRTRPGARVALALADGVQLRVDEGSIVTLSSATGADLRRGAIYVDSGSGAPGTAGPAFELLTPVGSVRHLGTQYQARLAEGMLKVGVREGRVQYSGSAGVALGAAGEQLVIAGTGAAARIERERLEPHDSSWRWAGAVAPAIDIEGRPLDEFLAWAGRETGREVVYDSPAVRSAAAGIVLRGSVAGLEPDAALAAVLSTTPLRHAVVDGTLRIGR